MSELSYKLEGDNIFLREEKSRQRYTIKKNELKTELENALKNKGKKRITKRFNHVHNGGESFEIMIIPNNSFYPSKYYVKNRLKNTGIEDDHYLTIIIQKENNSDMDFLNGNKHRHKTEMKDKVAINFVEEILDSSIHSKIKNSGNSIAKKGWNKNGENITYENELKFNSEEFIESARDKKALKEKNYKNTYRFSDIDKGETYIDSNCYICETCSSSMVSFHLDEEDKEECILLYCSKCRDYFLRKEIGFSITELSDYNMR